MTILDNEQLNKKLKDCVRELNEYGLLGEEEYDRLIEGIDNITEGKWNKMTEVEDYNTLMAELVEQDLSIDTIVNELVKHPVGEKKGYETVVEDVLDYINSIT